MLRILLSVVFCASFIAGATRAQTALAPIEAYGELPTISAMALSPDGEHLAFIQRSDGVDALHVINLENNESVYAIGVGKIKTNNVAWAGNKHVILRAYDTTRITGFLGRLDFSAAFSANIETKKIIQLLKNTEEIYPGQSGLGKIVAHRAGTNDVYMPAYLGDRYSAPTYGLVRVDLDTGRGRIHQKGNFDGVDWFVDTDGTILAREGYDNKSNEYRVDTKQSGRWETVLDFETENGPKGLVGVTPDKSSLVVFLRNDDGYNELRRLSYDGSYGPAEMTRENTEIDRILVDENRVVFGVAYGGLQPAYDFFDEDLAKDVKDMQDEAPNASVRLTSWSDGFKKLLFYIEGSGYAGTYYLLNRETGGLSRIASSRPDIPETTIGEVLTIRYKAQDGLEIPGVMTVPYGSELKNLPAIIMPHGGPESHSTISFHWMAQYFASRGYLVFQPNFRGSDGFGRAFTEAGYGGWGGVMQQDITDGVAALKAGGMIDPERVCIVGASYGGYAALAGGAFTPDLYKCVAAIAPVSDLPRMLIDERRDHGKDHWVLNYWERAIANGDATRDTLREKSPAMYAENFQAPVLIIHGKDDLVVKINQSRRMEKALERADKQVELIELRGEDHYLSTQKGRLSTLQALDGFIAAHIGPHAGG